MQAKGKVVGRSLPMGVTVETSVDLARYLPYRVHRLSVLVSTQDASDKPSRTIKIREWRIIMVLASFGPLTIGEISERLWADAASTTRGVQILSRDELVMVRTPKNDRRKQIVTLSEEGARVYDSIMPGRSAFSEKVLSVFSDEERAVFFGLMDRMENHLSTMYDKEEDPFDDV